MPQYDYVFRSRGHLRRLGIAASVAALLLATTFSTAFAGSWTEYHLHDSHDGNDTTTASPNSTPTQAWHRTFGVNDKVYAEPLVYQGFVYVVTIDNNVYALNETTGQVVWTLNVAPPVTTSTLPCGNVGPHNGILSTPVIDPAANRLYVLAFVSSGGAHHVLYAIDLAMRAVTWSVYADAPGSDPTIEQQRGALAFHGSNVYVPYGGLAGDCGSYHGYVVAISTASHGQVATWTSNPGDTMAGSWAASGLAIDASGNVFVTTGNGTYNNGTAPNGWNGSEEVAKLSSTLSPVDYWYPSDWQNLDNGDTDIGSMGPLLLGNNYVFQAGKNGVGYLLSQSGMHTGAPSPYAGGSELYSAQVSSLTSDACFGGAAFDGTNIYVPCEDGLYALKLNTSPSVGFSLAWNTSVRAQPPIIAAGEVWDVDPDSNTLSAYDPASTNPVSAVASVSLADSVNRFSTPSAADGLLFVPEYNGVEAFHVSNAGPPPAPAAPGPTERVGGATPSSADATSGFSGGRVDVALTGTDNAIWHTWTTDNGATYNWESLGGVAGSSPSIVSWGAGRLDVFVRGTDGQLWHRWFSGGWHSWEPLGGKLVGAPDAASWAANRLDVVVRGTDNHVWHKWWNGAAWRGWEDLGGLTNADPSAVSTRFNQLEVFVRGTDNALWHRWWGGSGWSGWSSLGGVLAGGPDASSWGGGRVDVFVRGTDNMIWRRFWDPNGGYWRGWSSLGGSWTADPGAGDPAVGTIDVFERGRDGALWRVSTS